MQQGGLEGAPSSRAVTGVVAALEEELAPLRRLADAAGARPHSVLGVEVTAVRLPEGPVLLACSGVGKVAAARAAAALVTAGATRLLVVGTCGGLARATPVGALVHAELAVQWDLAVREGREHRADPTLLAAWRTVAPGDVGHYLTADRPAVRLIERWRRHRALSRSLARAVSQAPSPAPPGSLRSDAAVPPSRRPVAVADMETAAVAAIAAPLALPWAALRAVSDAARFGHAGRFLANLPVQGGRAAATVPLLLAALANGCTETSRTSAGSPQVPMAEGSSSGALP